MQQLVKHLLANNLDEILSKSLLHCHCKGLHSIMLSESLEKTIRLYICVPENEMHKNFPENFGNNDMTIAFHPHHCNLTLHCIKGRFLNWEVKEVSAGIVTTKYKYHSKIKEGDLSFEKLDTAYLETTMYRWLYEGNAVQMKANEIHTVACEYGKLSAWLVYEGKEDDKYNSLCWSNTNVNSQNFNGLYVKPTHNEVLELLTMVGLLE